MSNYDLLIQKLDQFIRKYYLNQLIRGVLYSSAVIIGLFLAFTLLEHEFFFNTGVRKGLFYGFIGFSIASLAYWVLLPLSHYFKLGRIIDHEQAAHIIGHHFTSVQDKLLNVLQLKKQSLGLTSADLINASIEQKTESIKLVPFKAAIDLKKNRQYLKYALPPALALLVMLFAAPSLITESTHRIINNNTAFEKAAPFHFNIKNEDLSVVQYDDFDLNIQITGSVLPDEVFVEVDNFQYRMKKLSKDQFRYTFNSVQKNIAFNVFSGSVRSDKHELDVLLKPNLSSFEVSLDYPSYTGRKDEVLNNIGDMLLPEGTKVKWTFESNNTDILELGFTSNNERIEAKRIAEQRFSAQKRIYKSDSYKVYISNKAIPTPDSVSYIVNVTPDQYPEINVEVFEDSLASGVIYFVGNASDDYGLENLSFNLIRTDERGGQINETETLLNPQFREIQYDHILDINALQLKPGEKLSYYFEVFDNDAVNGSKSAKTAVMEFEKPTVEEFEEQEQENEEDIKDKLKKSIEESKKIKEELKKMREKLLQKQEPDWEDRKEFEKLFERQQEVEKALQEAKEKFEENLKNQEEFTERSEEIQEKQEKMQELFEEAVDKETQELMDKIQELLEELNKEDMIQMMEDMQMSEEAMEKNNERLLELFKNLEMEKEIQDMTEKLEELAEEQEDLSEKTENSSESQDSLQNQQEELNKEFDKLQEKMDEMQQKNQELERPKDLGEDTPEQMEEIKKDMEQSQDQLQKQQNKSASKKQKRAAQKMKEMAQKMQSNQQSQNMDQMQEDIAALRQLLENLVTMSFDQEDLINSIKRVNINTPTYVSQIQEQFKLKDDFQLIQDSLQALAKRVSQIEGFVTEKVVEIESNLGHSIDELEERQKNQAEDHQRKTMKNVNDLALMLSETMQQMQEQMGDMMMGSQMCNKPGGAGSSGQKPMDKITEGQQKLGEDMKKMGEGKGQGENGKPSAKDFAESAARQAELRRALEAMQEQKMEQGKGSELLQEIIEEMDKVEVDLVNKRMDSELMLRQQDILTKLLEAEKAEREREFDNKRKAEIGEEKLKELPPELKEYLKERESQIDLYNKISPSLRPYFRQLVDEYYKSLKTN
ncbi:MAG: DUF4175 domain-containing protein [Saprospiraceae bacterium]|nr:DUF4175 domain-containing protein [Saprospiraceae bacterium]